MKRFIAIVLAIITIFSVVSVSAYAAVRDTSNMEISMFNVPVRKTATSVAQKFTVSYSNPDMIADSYAGEILEVKFDNPGTFYFDYNAVALGKNCTVELYSDEILNTTVGYSEYISSDSLVGKHDIDIPKAGVYYLVFSTYTTEYTDPYVNTIEFTAYSSSNADRTLTKNVWSNSCYKSTGTYFKVNVTKDCVVNLSSNKQEVYVKLFNSKKVELQPVRTSLELENNFTTSYYLKKGTYYILAQTYEDGDYQIRYKTASIATLSNKKFKSFNQAYTGLYMYAKFTPKSSGYVKVTGDNFSGKVWLCNSKKKVISDYVYMDSEDGEYAVFGVEKGKTYYLRLDNNYNVGKIKYTNVAVKDSSGAKRSKATKMPEKKWIGGYIAAGDKSKDWFKFTVNGNKYWKIDIKGNVHDKIKVCVYDNEGNELDYFNFYDYDKSRYIYSYSKFEKGTYYVSVARGSSKASGSYSLKFTSSNKQLVK